ncbi:pro-neuregulin-1, membrane-bound isoform-like isoform X1 [Littorina saxatilis]|uniref:pro-neuregulin-1, membrane-bound isoform-like isoform X1 n=1 Tax=Littorina saxatilis TaxID=31220 RepID=UPI0038B54214
MRWSNGSPPAASTRVVFPRWSPPWPLLLLVVAVGLLARAPPVISASAGASGGGRKEICGTTFLDSASSALLADVVLEGRVRQKMPSSGDGGQGGGSGRYNATIQVRKHAWKGKELVNQGRKARKLLIGVFQDDPSATASPPEDVTVASDSGAVNGAGGGRRRGRRRGRRGAGDDDGGGDVDVDVTVVNCVGKLEDGATYIFFLKDVGDKKGRYFRISALPIKKSKKDARTINRILKKNAAQKPKVRPIKGSTSVTKGSSLTLRCKAKAKPNPVFTWFHNGQEIISSSRRRIKTGKRGSRLKIRKADPDNSGVYVCQAKNAVGEDTSNVTVKVTAPELIHKACEKQTFCFNGGTCRYITDLQQTFCQCPESYAGRRCEKEVAHPSILKGEATLLYERTLIIVGIVIALLVFVVICIASYFLANRRRKRWEAKRRMKQRQGAEHERLLDRPDGQPHPQHYIPSFRPQAEKETQTDNDLHSSDYPHPQRQHESEPNFVSNMPNNSDNFFLRKSFPLNTTAPPHDVSEQHLRDLERRGSGSRSRLKAVSVDDNCADRPKSWKAEVPDSKSMPVIRDGSEGGESKEKIEMDDLSHTLPPMTVSNSSPGLSGSGRDGPAVVVVPNLPDFLSSPELMSVPVRMETQPRDNMHAQLKSPEDESCRPVVLPPDYSPLSPLLEQPRWNHVQPDSPPINGVLEGLDSEGEEEEQPLPVLHISEEDLNGNVSKPNSFESEFLPPPPEYMQAADPASPSLSSPTSSSSPAAYPRPKNLSSLLDGVYVPLVGHSPGSGSEDDSAGFLPRTLSSTEASSPTMDGGTPSYSFDPCMDSDPNEFDDQFMHGSPKKGAGPFREAEDKQDYERRLQNVRADQEAIPI